MVVAVLADTEMKAEFLSREFPAGVEFVWADSLRSLLIIEAEVYFDLQFSFDLERIRQLSRLLPSPVIVNAVEYTMSDMGKPFLRINGWPTMLKRKQAEISSSPGLILEQAGSVFDRLGWPYTIVPDIAGMVAPRVVAMIINEAFFTLEAGISSEEEIDTAMKFGTNYPFGPFEWFRKIGPGRVLNLLKELERKDQRYTPCSLLVKAASGNDQGINS